MTEFEVKAHEGKYVVIQKSVPEEPPPVMREYIVEIDFGVDIPDIEFTAHLPKDMAETFGVKDVRSSGELLFTVTVTKSFTATSEKEASEIAFGWAITAAAMVKNPIRNVWFNDITEVRPAPEKDE
jgi:hypothetical protein